MELVPFHEKSCNGVRVVSTYTPLAGSVLRTVYHATCSNPGCSCLFQSKVIRLELYPSPRPQVSRAAVITSVLFCLLANNHELAIHPRCAPNKFDPGRPGEATDGRCQRFLVRSVYNSSSLSPTSLCVTRTWDGLGGGHLVWSFNRGYAETLTAHCSAFLLSSVRADFRLVSGDE